MAANYYKYNANMNDRTYFTSVIVDTAGNAKRYFSNVESEIYFGDKEMDDLYIAELKKNLLNPEKIEKVADDLKIVYTPLHGTGNRLASRILKEIGFKNSFKRTTRRRFNR